ncbi:MAG: hypothetical protein M3Y87_23815 [Myxococcota bacterium]|nr:hypothetical protein [Myxococcota bacterium]
MAHRDEREATRARADAAARDLEDAQRELDRLAPEKARLERENEALRSKLVHLSPEDAPPLHPLMRKPARANIVTNSIALGVLTTLLMAGLALASLITNGMVAPVRSEPVSAAAVSADEPTAAPLRVE